MTRWHTTIEWTNTAIEWDPHDVATVPQTAFAPTATLPKAMDALDAFTDERALRLTDNLGSYGSQSWDVRDALCNIVGSARIWKGDAA